MAPSDNSGNLNRVNNPLYGIQEGIDLGGEAVSAGEYTKLSDVTEFRYSAAIGDVFKNQRLANLNGFGESWGFLAGGDAVVFTDTTTTSGRSEERRVGKECIYRWARYR